MDELDSCGPRSLVLLNTGDGKGKSTAAFGVLVRALAQGWRVAVVQFLKSDDWQTGEEVIFRGLGVEWLKGGGGFTWEPARGRTSRSLARAAWRTGASALASGEFRLVVLDEITIPITLGWLDGDEVAAAIQARAIDVNVVVTGRHAPQALLDAADLVTEMVNVRHPFERGVLARPGIDY